MTQTPGTTPPGSDASGPGFTAPGSPGPHTAPASGSVPPGPSYGQQPPAGYGTYTAPAASNVPPAGGSYQAPQPPYGTHSPYGQSAPAPQAYGVGQGGYPQQAPAPYGAAPSAYQDRYSPPVKRSPMLGLVSLAIIVVAAMVCIVFAYQFGHGLGVLMKQMGITTQGAPSTSSLQNDPRLQAYITQSAGIGQAIGLSSIAGLAAWIAAIVATATRRGRAYGITGIILGVIAPIAAFMAYGVAFAAAIGA